MNYKVLVLGAALAACFSAQAAVSDFTVNGIKVTAAEQEQMIAAATARGQKRTPELEEAVKKNLVARTAVLSEARKAGTDKKPEVKQAIQQAEEEIVSRAFLADYIRANPVSDADIKKVYDEQKSHYGDTDFHLNHIAVKTQEDAKKIQDRLAKGESFSNVARAASLDPSAKRNGGDMGWVNSGALPPEMVKGLQGLKGKQTYVATGPAGFEVVQKVASRKAQAFPTLDQAKHGIRHALEGEKVAQHIQSLASKAEVK